MRFDIVLQYANWFPQKLSTYLHTLLGIISWLKEFQNLTKKGIWIKVHILAYTVYLILGLKLEIYWLKCLNVCPNRYGFFNLSKNAKFGDILFSPLYASIWATTNFQFESKLKF